ncbi:hypothetical protein BB558_000258 [Smittium angustum]|uniref:SLM1/RGC1-like BAR-like domain-containing protein n=1 Tax=Smittium angustum TaxID=133377 RepID=A0A2U1JF03_SMIAN|nr:hypothetical protein BB558_000258 [Smittium angustum]
MGVSLMSKDKGPSTTVVDNRNSVATANTSGSEGMPSRISSGSSTQNDYTVSSKDIFETPAVRIKTVKDILDFYIKYFTKYSKVESKYIKSMKKTNKLSDPLDEKHRKAATKRLSGSGANPEQIFLPADANGIAGLLTRVKYSQERSLSFHEEMVNRVDTKILPGLLELKKQVKKYISGYYKTMEKTYLNMRNQNKVIMKRMTTLDQSITDAKVGRGVCDPVIAKIEVENSIVKEKELEDTFKKNIDLELEKIKNWETQVIVQIKENVEDYYKYKKNELDKEHTLFTESYQSMNNFNYGNEWAKFENRIKGDIDTYTSITSKQSEHVSTVETQNRSFLGIQAQGEIKMKTGIPKTFKTFFAVLTACDYIHLYKNQESYNNLESPIHSFYLHSLDLLHKDDKNRYGIYKRDSGIFGTSKHMLLDTVNNPTIFNDIGTISKPTTPMTVQHTWYSVLYEIMVKSQEEHEANTAIPVASTSKAAEVAANPEAGATQATESAPKTENATGAATTEHPEGKKESIVMDKPPQIPNDIIDVSKDAPAEAARTGNSNKKRRECTCDDNKYYRKCTCDNNHN